MMNDEELGEQTAEVSEDIGENIETAADTETADEHAEPESDSGTEEESSEQKALAEMKEQLLRTMAEYDNFRKRTAREKEALRTDIITDVTSKFLPIMDNLERALSTDCSDENYKNGVKMIHESFMETLKNLGVEEIPSDGEKFDPNLHQAVHREEDSEAESGTVVKTFAKGYRIGEKVIRFAMVSVAN